MQIIAEKNRPELLHIHSKHIMFKTSWFKTKCSKIKRVKLNSSDKLRIRLWKKDFFLYMIQRWRCIRYQLKNVFWKNRSPSKGGHFSPSVILMLSIIFNLTCSKVQKKIGWEERHDTYRNVLGLKCRYLKDESSDFSFLNVNM